MNSLPGRIMEYAKATPEATPIRADDLLHLGNRAAVVRALSRLVRSDRLLRICRGVYMRPIQTRFGLRAPRLEKALASLSALWGEVIVPNGGGAANWLGLTTQNTVRSVYLTSGPNRLLHFGAHAVELRHAPAWQLTAPHRTAGVVHLRAGVARPQRGREEPRCRDSAVHRGGLERSRRRPGRNARVDGGAAEQAARAWLRSDFSASGRPKSPTKMPHRVRCEARCSTEGRRYIR